jgi:hypothetical protein
MNAFSRCVVASRRFPLISGNFDEEKGRVF